MNTLLNKGMAGLLWLVATSVGAETLAMTVEYDQGDVGLAHQVWTTQYYTDEQGRLVRKVQIVKGDFVGDPDTTEVTAYLWDANGVRWDYDRFDGEKVVKVVRYANEGLERLVIEPSGTTSDHRELRFLDKSGTSWTDGMRQFEWSATKGYSERFADLSDGDSSGRSGWTSSGAALVEWFQGNENNRVILDRRPDRIYGTFVQPNLNLDGWDVTGDLDISGRGLWHENKLIRLAHMAILDDDRNLAWSAPLVWTKNYLR